MKVGQIDGKLAVLEASLPITVELKDQPDGTKAFYFEELGEGPVCVGEEPTDSQLKSAVDHAFKDDAAKTLTKLVKMLAYSLLKVNDPEVTKAWICRLEKEIKSKTETDGTD